MTSCHWDTLFQILPDVDCILFHLYTQFGSSPSPTVRYTISPVTSFPTTSEERQDLWKYHGVKQLHRPQLHQHVKHHPCKHHLIPWVHHPQVGLTFKAVSLEVSFNSYFLSPSFSIIPNCISSWNWQHHHSPPLTAPSISAERRSPHCLDDHHLEASHNSKISGHCHFHTLMAKPFQDDYPTEP